MWPLPGFACGGAAVGQLATLSIADGALRFALPFELLFRITPAALW